MKTVLKTPALGTVTTEGAVLMDSVFVLKDSQGPTALIKLVLTIAATKGSVSMGSVFAVLVLPDQTVRPKAVPITATIKDGVSKGGACVDVGSLDRTVACVRRERLDPTVIKVSQTHYITKL